MITTPPISELVEFHYSSFSKEKCTIAPHLHHFYQLDVILSGRVIVKIEGRKPFVGKAGEAWLIPPLLRHGYEIKQPFRQASFKFHLAPQYWHLLGKHFLRRRMSAEFIALSETTGKRYSHGSHLTLPQVVATATLCVIDFMDSDSPRADHNDNFDAFRTALWPVLEQVSNTPHEGWTVGRMAAACHLSTDYFSRCFHQILGQTPQQYALEARIRSAAATLLADPSRPIKDIAEAANYATIHAFSRAFRRVMGIAPAAYRRTRNAL